MTKSTHGGKRPGAGRPRTRGEVVRVVAEIDAKLARKLDRRAVRDGKTRTAVVAEALGEYLT